MSAMAGREDGKSPDDMHELRVYLTRTFLLALLGVLAAEFVVAWFESVFLAPQLELFVAYVTGEAQQLGATGLLTLFGQVVDAFAQAIREPDLAQGSTLGMGVVTFVVAVALAMAPIVVGSGIFGVLAGRGVDQLQRRRDEERQHAARVRNLMVSDMAHDLRTPVTAIGGLSQALLDGVVPPDEQRGCLEAINAKADAMGDLVTLLLEYSQLDSEGFELHKEKVDLSQLLLRACAAAYTDAERAGMRLVASVPEDPCPIEADERQLARVFANLIANAIRHNSPGATIAVALVRRPGVAIACVADTGAPIGTPTEELFRPFSRGDAARGADGGYGLGLSICKRICDVHGFGLELRQPYGTYAKAFVVTVPVE